MGIQIGVAGGISLIMSSTLGKGFEETILESVLGGCWIGFGLFHVRVFIDGFTL